MKVTGNTIFITGGGSGIGLALAKAFLQLDNVVIVCGRSLEKLKQAKSACPALHTVQLDVAHTDEVAKAVKELEATFGKVNILVNNAAVNHRYYFNEFNHSLGIIDEEIDINLKAPFKLTKLFLPLLMKCTEAAVINISSVLAMVSKPSRPIYSATKAGLHSMTKALRVQLRGTPVKVFEVFPPTVDTEMVKHIKKFKMSPEKLAKIIVKGLRRDQFEMRPGFSQPVYWLTRAFPSLIDWVVAMQKPS